MKDIVEKYKFNQSTWTHKGFHGVLHTFGGIVRGILETKKFPSKIGLFFATNDYIHWYWNDNDLMRIRKIFFIRLKKNPNYLKELKMDWYKKLRKFDKIITKVNEADLIELSSNELADLYRQYNYLYSEEFGEFMALGDAISMHADRYLVPEFKKILGNDFTEVFPQIITTKHKSFINKELHDRQKLIDIYKLKNSIPQSFLLRHSKKYFYIKNNYAEAIYLTPDDFLKIIKDDLKKVKNKKNEVEKKNNKLSKGYLIKKYKLTSWHKTLLYVMDEFFGIQDIRKKYALISNYYQFKFLKEASKRTGIPLSFLKYSIYWEYSDILSGKINNKDILKKRKKLSACIYLPDNYKIYTGQKAQKIFNYFNKQEEKDITRGIVVSRGKVEGRAKIILKIDDVEKMKQGDIIISSMTRPEMVPAMEKAAGIVTDEGGLTCHAAIISRELGVPCIVGTKIATKVLKDGDLVEVDADKGIVKILKRKK